MSSIVKPIGLLLAMTKTVISGSRWHLKPKIPQQRAEVSIVTPLGEEILVGDGYTDVLLSESGFNNWQTKTKII